jgi:hypothetical protein
LARLVCNRFIEALAVSQQFNGCARRRSAGNDRVTGSLNAGNIEGGFRSGGIGLRRRNRKLGRQGIRVSLRRCESCRALVSILRCR